jgi:hypothetical protein
MRVPRVRFTVRRMMGVVAIVSVMLAFSITWQRVHNEDLIRLAYQRKASYHAMMEKDLYFGISIIEKHSSSDDKKAMQVKRSYREWAERHAELKRKYEHAAAHPPELLPPP